MQPTIIDGYETADTSVVQYTVVDREGPLSVIELKVGHPQTAQVIKWGGTCPDDQIEQIAEQMHKSSPFGHLPLLRIT